MKSLDKKTTDKTLYVTDWPPQNTIVVRYQSKRVKTGVSAKKNSERFSRKIALTRQGEGKFKLSALETEDHITKKY